MRHNPRRRNPQQQGHGIDPRLLAADGARYFSDDALAEADREAAPSKSRTALVLMHPRDFLKMAEPGQREESQAALERVLDAGTRLSDVPRLFIDVSRTDPRLAVVTGHEGRHRSRALLARGVTQMPVRIHSQNIRWGEQTDPESWDYEPVLPSVLVGEGANKHNTLAMTIPLHYPELVSRLRPRTNPRRRNPDPTTTPVSSAAFRRWFGDSKVVDTSGKPLVVYHGSPQGDIEVFEIPRHRRTPAFFFSDDPDLAAEYGENLYSAYLHVVRPLVVDAKGADWSEIPQKYVPMRGWPAGDKAFARALMEAHDSRFTSTDVVGELAAHYGFDGAIIRNVIDSSSGDTYGLTTVYIVFDPRQIKSARENAGTFDPDDPSIYRNPRSVRSRR